MATFIGYHLRGKFGAIAAVLGLITPPFFAILAVAYFIKNADSKVIEMLDTITISVIVLVGASFIELAGVCIKNIFTLILFFVTLFLFLFTNLPPVTIIIILTIFGITAKSLMRKIKGAKI